MSSNATNLSEEQIMNEELGILKQTSTNNQAKVVLEPSNLPETITLPEKEEEEPKEQPLNEDNEVLSTKQEAEVNDYFNYLAEIFSENQKKQSEKAKDIVKNSDYKATTVDGKEQKLTYHKLNRSQDMEVRNIQRQYNKVRGLSEKLRNSYRDPEKDSKYEEFKVADFVSSSLLKGKIDGNSSRETIAEVLDEEYERIFSERFDIFTRDFFGLSVEQIENYVYKDLTYLADVAYSEYSSTPY
jgi:hypothetical protein